MHAEAAALLAEYEKRRGEAELEAKAIIEQAKREAAAFQEEARARITDYVSRRTKAVETRIAQADEFQQRRTHGDFEQQIEGLDQDCQTRAQAHGLDRASRRVQRQARLLADR